MQRKAIGLLLGTTLALAFGVHNASAAKLQVGTCTTNPLQYPTINAAVAAANNGDVVQICPGTYQEEVLVTKSIGLTNVPSMDSPTVAIPPGGAVQNITKLSGEPGAAQIGVIGAKANIKNLVVDGTGNNINECGFELVGIYFQNAGGTIENNTVENQLLPPGADGCQSGQGVYVQSVSGGTPAVSIVGNTVSNFDKNGITVNEAAAKGTIKNNTVTGNGSIDYIAQNGIQIGFGATGHVTGNHLAGFIYSPATTGSAGVLLYDIDTSVTAAPVVSGNIVSDSQYGVVLDAVNGTSGSLVSISNNTISNATFAGVGLYSDPGAGLNDDYIKVYKNTISGTTPYDDVDACSDYNIIQKNSVSTSSEGGIHLDGLCQELNNSTTGINNLVSANTIDNNCVGILSGPPVGANTIKPNNIFSGNTNNYEYGTDSFSCSGHHSGVSKRLVPLAAVQPLSH